MSQKVLTEARTSMRVARGRVEVNESPARVIVVDEPLMPGYLVGIIPPEREFVDEINKEG